MKTDRTRTGKTEMLPKIRKSAAILLTALLFLLTGCASSELYELRDTAITQYRLGNYELAEELFEEALTFGNGEVGEAEMDILRYRADCELRLRKYDEASETLGILMQLDESEDNRAAYGELEKQFAALEELKAARERMEAGEYEEAYTVMDKYAALGGDALEAAAWFNKAVCAEYMGRWEEAAELFADYTAIYPDDEEAAKEYAFCRTR